VSDDNQAGVCQLDDGRGKCCCNCAHQREVRSWVNFPDRNIDGWGCASDPTGEGAIWWAGIGSGGVFHHMKPCKRWKERDQ
jgi:hypothetical protein